MRLKVVNLLRLNPLTNKTKNEVDKSGDRIVALLHAKPK
jgi:hypothetical protein